jgi:site-specific recombinase XerD
MHVDAKGTVGQYPVLLVRATLRHLRSRLQWGLAELQAAAGLAPGNGRALVRVLRAEGLIEAVGRGIWTMTQAGVTFSAATAAQPVTRATAERTLSEFLERVTEVNQNPYFLAKVTTVVLFGSMLKYQAHLFQEKKLNLGTVQQYVAALRFFFNKTLKRHYLLDDIPMPKRHRKLPEILSPDEVALLIDSASNLFHQTMLMTLYSTGMRRAELCHLKTTDIDSQRMIVHIRQGKGGHDRDVPLSQKLLALVPVKYFA